MPTPFMHLTFALELLSNVEIAEPFYNRRFPTAGAFLLGNTAADVQTLTHEPRYTTHFYHVRGQQKLWGWEQFLSENPQLATSTQLDRRHAAFTCGYLVHLLWDEMWTREIFTPFFMEAPRWNNRLTYAVYHNALRAVQDRNAYIMLQKKIHITDQIAEVQPDHWLPFASDEVLLQWRNWLVTQLEDDGESQTINVFANRMGVSVTHFSEAIENLKRKNFDIPGLSSAISTVYKHAQARSRVLILSYIHSLLFDNPVIANRVQSANV
jgi:hypothetical protein